MVDSEELEESADCNRSYAACAAPLGPPLTSRHHGCTFIWMLQALDFYDVVQAINRLSWPRQCTVRPQDDPQVLQHAYRSGNACCLVLAGRSWMDPTCLEGGAPPPMRIMIKAWGALGAMIAALGMPWPWGWMLTSLLLPQQGTEERQKGGEAGTAGMAATAF